MILPLDELARRLAPGTSAPEISITGWSVDSRTVAAGDLFFALRGPNHDGHDYVSAAFEKGAAAAVVDREITCGGPLVRVADSLVALQSAASWARDLWGGTVVAVTGSAGKTTTKDAIAHLLSARLAVDKTSGNFNNHVGLPLSILRLDGACRIGVVEIGMNHAGEIRHLSSIARPDIAVVTNVGYAHIENFDSIDAVAAAKRELVESLPAGGTAVLNADDERVAGFRTAHSGPVITFGISNAADVCAERVERTETGARFHLAGAGWFETALEGPHAVLNILAALAAGKALGVEPADLKDAVRTLEPSPMRGRRFLHNGITIFDDCYNSNPDAVRAMLKTLRDTPARRRIAVLGEMLELGRWTETLHQEIGRDIAACRVDVLVGIRGAARFIADAAANAGLSSSAAYFFPTPEQAGDHLKTIAQPGDVILFKGSRATHVERALERFLSSASTSPATHAGPPAATLAGLPSQRRTTG